MTRTITALICLTTLSPLAPCAAQDKHDYVWCMGYGKNDSTKYFGGTRISFTETTAVASFFQQMFQPNLRIHCFLCVGFRSDSVVDLPQAISGNK